MEKTRCYSSLIGINVPDIFFLDQNPETYSKVDDVQKAAILSNVTMKHFHGMEEEEPSTISALLDFSYYISTKDLDKAYVSIRKVNNHSIWESMARYSVENNRIDIAELCLAHCGHALGVGAVRRAKLEPENEVALATVAIQLGMEDIADKLLSASGRIDLNFQLKRQQGRWLESFHADKSEVSARDKVNHFHYSKYLERMGESELALKHLEKSSAMKKSIIRKMIESKTTEEIEEYVNDINDKDAIVWYASYLESIGYLEKAEYFYMAIGDDTSRVRLACHRDDLETAMNIAEESNQLAATYHLARHLEANGNIQNAVDFYTKSGKYNHAIKLCKIHKLDIDLMHLALKSPAPQMLVCASYFEANGDLENACQLYIKGGNNKRAYEICSSILENKHISTEKIRNLIFTLVEQEPTDIPEKLILQLAVTLFKFGDSVKAVEILKKKSQSLQQILSICAHNKIPLDDGIFDILLPEGTLNKMETSEKNKITHLIGGICETQGNFKLACKIYTQGGDRIRAMKCLLKTGNTKNIITYATAARKSEIYLLAANYLQTL